MSDKEKDMAKWNEIMSTLNPRQQIVFHNTMHWFFQVMRTGQTGYTNLTRNPEERDELITVFKKMTEWVEYINTDFDIQQNLSGGNDGRKQN